MNMIELWGVTVSIQKHFWAPPVKVLNELSLKVEPGSCFGLLGPNGAGKTTTLRVALGLAKPQSGTVKLFDKNPRRGSRACRSSTRCLERTSAELQ